jgi:hypothetical protein
MRRVLLILAAVLVTLGLHAAPAAANHAAPEQCSGYFTTAAHTTAGGNLYESKTNICMGISTYTTSSMDTDAIVRKQCYRNGVAYGDGTGGCRWSSRVELHGYGPIGGSNVWYEVAVNDWCVTCGGTYVQDSGRVYTGRFDFNHPGSDLLKARSKSEGGDVRFYLADGTTVLKTEQSLYSTEVYVP